jgi:hypothetical protein
MSEEEGRQARRFHLSPTRHRIARRFSMTVRPMARIMLGSWAIGTGVSRQVSDGREDHEEAAATGGDATVSPVR